jgi:hypothetical protein
MNTENGTMTSKRKSQTRVVVALVGIGIIALITVGGNMWPVAAAVNRFVSVSGSDTNFDKTPNDCTDPEAPCATIQHAISVAGNGDLIVLGAGTYFENVIINKNVTIQGDGTEGSTVNGNNSGTVLSSLAGVTASLRELTIREGSVQIGPGSGGGVLNNGDLTVIGCTIVDNEALGSSQAGAGGGIFNSGSLVIINSTISDNTAGLGSGGGIFNNGLGSVTVTNATISGNSAFSGSGIFNFGTLNLTNTIIGGGLGGGADIDNQGTIASNVRNLIQDGSGSPAVSGDPKLGPLQNNGGPTFTHALLADSPAIDAGDDSVLSDPLNLSADQRSFGFARLACAHVDIGAVESNSGVPPTITCPPDIRVVAPVGQDGATVSYTVTATDPCGPVTPTCEPPSSSVFPVGMTFVGCFAINPAGLSSSCAFTVTVAFLPVCIQDDTTRDTLRFDPATGAYEFTRCSTGQVLSGTAAVTVKGLVTTLQFSGADRRITATIDKATRKGSATIQLLPQRVAFTITDRNTLNNSCACQQAPASFTR